MSSEICSVSVYLSSSTPPKDRKRRRVVKASPFSLFPRTNERTIPDISESVHAAHFFFFVLFLFFFSLRVVRFQLYVLSSQPCFLRPRQRGKTQHTRIRIRIRAGHENTRSKKRASFSSRVTFPPGWSFKKLETS